MRGQVTPDSGSGRAQNRHTGGYWNGGSQGLGGGRGGAIEEALTADGGRGDTAFCMSLLSQSHILKKGYDNQHHVM